MKKFDLSKIKLNKAPTEKFTLEAAGDEWEVEVQPLKGKAILALSDLKEDSKKIEAVKTVLCNGMVPPISAQDAEDLIDGDIKAALQIVEHIMQLTENYNAAVKDERDNAKDTLKKK